MIAPPSTPYQVDVENVRMESAAEGAILLDTEFVFVFVFLRVRECIFDKVVKVSLRHDEESVKEY